MLRQPCLVELELELELGLGFGSSLDLVGDAEEGAYRSRQFHLKGVKLDMIMTMIEGACVPLLTKLSSLRDVSTRRSKSCHSVWFWPAGTKLHQGDTKLELTHANSVISVEHVAQRFVSTLLKKNG